MCYFDHYSVLYYLPLSIRNINSHSQFDIISHFISSNFYIYCVIHILYVVYVPFGIDCSMLKLIRYWYCNIKDSQTIRQTVPLACKYDNKKHKNMYNTYFHQLRLWNAHQTD